MPLLNGVYDWQEGPRGDEKGFVSGMLMGMARRDLGNGTLQLRAMLSPDPLMGRRGYPLLLASGETADGVTPLVDRQHPHDLFMELSASYSLPPRRRGQRLPLCRPARRARLRPARLHAPHVDHGFARGADQPPLARFDPHHLRRRHRRPGRSATSSSRPRASTAASRTSTATNIETGPLDSTALRALLEPDAATCRCRRAGRISSSPEQLEPGREPDPLVGERASTRGRSATDGWWSTTARLGPPRRRTTPSPSRARPGLGLLDALRPRRICRE